MTRESKRRTDSRFLDLVRAISDGDPVVWDREGSGSPEDTRTLERLRALEAVVSAHRSLGKTPLEDAPTVDAPASPSSQQTGGPFSWGPLTVGEKAAQGTRGEVYHAVDENGCEVALHLRRGDWPVDQAFLSVFMEEVDRQVALDHGNLLRVLGGGNHAGSPGLWTEWIHGASLEEVFVVRGALPVTECAGIALDLLAALSALHEAGFVGYGVDASRVLLCPDGRAVLAHSGCLFLREPERTELTNRGSGFDHETLGRLLLRAAAGPAGAPGGRPSASREDPSPAFAGLAQRFLDGSPPPTEEAEAILSRLANTPPEPPNYQ